jgi:hypothetical protein
MEDPGRPIRAQEVTDLGPCAVCRRPALAGPVGQSEEPEYDY